MANAVREVDDQADRHPDNESHLRIEWQAVNHVATDEHTQNRYEWDQRGPEGPRNVRTLIAEHHYAEANDHESEQSTNGHELTQQRDGEEAGNSSGHDASDDGGDVWRLKSRMDLAEDRRQQSIARHREKDARLAHEHYEDHRGESRDCTDVDEKPKPAQRRTGLLDRHEHRVGNIQLGVVGHARHHQRHQDVQHRADAKRRQDPDRHVALRILRFLSSGRYRVEADVGEEHHTSRPHDARPAVVTEFPGGVGRNEGMPVRRVHVHEAETNHEEYDRQLHEYDDVVESRRLLDADHEQCGHQSDEHNRRDVDDAMSENVFRRVAGLAGHQ